MRCWRRFRQDHQVYTGVTVLLCQGEDRCHGITFAERTDVHVYPMTCGEMKEYAQVRGTPG